MEIKKTLQLCIIIGYNIVNTLGFEESKKNRLTINKMDW